jgi:DNA-directed RNA polymerase specialized sigma24 family protein
VLEDLGRKHELWLAMALNMGVPPSLAEDLIQEMYLRLHRYVKDESKVYYKDTGTINRFYIWTTIRNMWMSARTYKAKRDGGYRGSRQTV